MTLAPRVHPLKRRQRPVEVAGEAGDADLEGAHGRHRVEGVALGEVDVGLGKPARGVGVFATKEVQPRERERGEPTAP